MIFKESWNKNINLYPTLKIALKERDDANAKVKNLIAERSRLQQTGDARVLIHEYP